MTAAALTIQCPKCGAVHAEMTSNTLDPGLVDQFLPCNRCGHNECKVTSDHAPLSVGVSVGLKMKGKAKGMRRPVLELKHHNEVHRDTGTVRHVHRQIERPPLAEGEAWIEEIIQEKDGVIVRKYSEPLKDHTGRGTAKRKRNA